MESGGLMRLAEKAVIFLVKQTHEGGTSMSSPQWENGKNHEKGGWMKLSVDHTGRLMGRPLRYHPGGPPPPSGSRKLADTHAVSTAAYCGLVHSRVCLVRLTKPRRK